jgi:hypothetical protein
MKRRSLKSATRDTDGAILRLCEEIDRGFGTWKPAGLAGDIAAARAEHDDLRARLAASEARVKELEATRSWALRTQLRSVLDVAYALHVNGCSAQHDECDACRPAIAAATVAMRDGNWKPTTAMWLREREEQAEAALPDAVRESMLALITVAEDCAAHDLYVAEGDAAVAEFRKRAPGRYSDESAGDHYRSAAEQIRRARALLGTAPASQVARLGLDGDALRAVREWQATWWARPTNSRTAPPGGDLRAIDCGLGDALRDATLYDVGDLKPLLRELKREYEGSGTGWWNALPPQWRKIAEEESK